MWSICGLVNILIFSGLRLVCGLHYQGPREFEMPGIELLNPTQKGWQAADLGNRLHRLAVIQDEAIRQVVRPARPTRRDYLLSPG